MNQKLPFYLAYPSPLLWDDDRINRRDYEYMKWMYPDVAKKILPYIEDECDRMEYDNSVMFDEYPDQLQLHFMCGRIYDKAKEVVEEPGAWLRDMITVMTFQEMYQRRSEHRKHRRRLY